MPIPAFIAAASRFVVIHLLFALCSPAWSGRLVLDDVTPSHDLTACIEYLEDPGQSLTIRDVRDTDPARFHAVGTTGLLNFGYSKSAFWLRIGLSNPVAGPRLLEIAYPALDRVELFAPATGGGEMVMISGDREPFSLRPFPHRNLVFPVDLPAGDSDLYLRVVSDGSLTVPTTLWRPDAFAAVSPGVYVLLAMYYGTLLALASYNLLLYSSVRDRAYLEYVLFALGMAVGNASANGFAQQFVWPEWPALANVAYPMGYSFAGLFGTLFTRTFLDTGRLAPRFDVLLKWMAWLFLLSMFAHVVSYRSGSALVSLGGLLVSGLALSAGIAAWRRGHPGARYFLLAWTLLLCGVAIMAMRNFGWLPTNFLTVYAMQIGSTVDLLLLSFALADRINTMRAEKESAQAELLAARQGMVETLKRSEMELESRVEMRTRELAAANAELREKEQALSHQAMHDPLTGVGNRVMLDEELRKAIGRANRLGSGVAVLLVDLDRFKPINDQHGHGIGDEVLRKVTARLLDCTRKNDTLARLGGDEFVLVLEGQDALVEARGAAEKMLGCMIQPFRVRGLDLTVGASIGIAVLGWNGNPDDLLRRADLAMYQAKRHGGNRYAVEGE